MILKRNEITFATIQFVFKVDISFTCRRKIPVYNAYVRRGEHRSSAGTLGQYYPDLKWGNYLGKPLLPNRKLHFSICLKEGRESL